MGRVGRLGLARKVPKADTCQPVKNELSNFDPPRRAATCRSLSLLLVLALALQVGVGLADSSTLLRESAGQANVVRALADAVASYAARPVKKQQERPIKISCTELASGADAKPILEVTDSVQPARMLRPGLLALPPPIL